MPLSIKLTSLLCIAVISIVAAESGPLPVEIKFNDATAAAEYYKSIVPKLKILEIFSGVDAFVNYYKPFIQNCYDNTGGGSAASSCDKIETNIWIREIALFHSRLASRLDDSGQVLLNTADSSWSSMVNKTRVFARALLDKMYEGTSGTMYEAMRGDDLNTIELTLYIQRALTLRDQACLVPDSCASSAFYDKELNVYYKKLADKQNSNNRQLLKTAQLQWIKSRDAQVALNINLLEAKYSAARNSNVSAQKAILEDRLIAPFIKARIRMFKDWLELKPAE